jgi:hypothetical protein
MEEYIYLGKGSYMFHVVFYGGSGVFSTFHIEKPAAHLLFLNMN